LQERKQTKQYSIAYIAIQSSSGQQSRKTSCVTTYLTLRKQVGLCNNTLNMAPCDISICRAQIKMKSMVSGSHAMNISNKNIVINCQLKNNKRCMIDGQGLSRIFYGSNVAVTFRNIIFSNGYSSISGGALYLSKSFVNLFNCSFMNNSAASGGAIMIKKSTFYMTGTESSFINNTGNRPGLVGYSSDFYLYDTIFKGNKMTKYVRIKLIHLLFINCIVIFMLIVLLTCSSEARVWLFSKLKSESSRLFRISPSDKKVPILGFH
jgi:hypothetical protein